MTTIQSLIDKYSSRSEGLTAISADEILTDLKELTDKDIDLYSAIKKLEEEQWVCMKHREFYRIIENLERGAFNNARLVHPLAGMKFDTFEDYKKQK